MAGKKIFTGADVTDAIEKACTEFQVSQDQLDIEIIKTGSDGIFGLIRRKAQIKVGIKSSKKLPDPVSVDAKPTAQKKTRAADAVDSPRPEPAQENLPIPPEVFPLVEEKLAGILKHMGFPSQVKTSEQNGKVVAHITGNYEEDIIGPDGQTLDGLQFLLRKMISRAFPGRIMVSLDAGDFREKRRQDLEEQALRLAEQVKETEKTRMLPALNPSERRIVHMCLQKDKTIRSRSVGDGIFKKILIYLPGKGKKRPARRRKTEAAAK